METISMLDVRKNTKSLVGRLLRGESFRITYRNRPVGELFPATGGKRISSDDPVYRLAKMSTGCSPRKMRQYAGLPLP